jgi:uncharacterized protein YecE (DUF72 family)
MPFDRDKFKQTANDLARQGLYIGTSSWKYPGWRGQLYEEDRYIWRGRWSDARFERQCLTEYAQVFKTVCVDAAYYQFPDPGSLEEMASQAPDDFRFTFKVTDQITIKRFANLPRHGRRAGANNQDFLNADLFASEFLAPCQPLKEKVGFLIFEFSRFYASDFARGRDFAEALDKFLGKLPKGWRYGVEIRNRDFLHPDYFAMLAKHGVGHIFNSWQDMPALEKQLAMPGSYTNSDFFGARLLLKPGRKFEDAVKFFKPYDRVKEPYAEGRAAGAQLIRRALDSEGKTRGFIYVNNRFEGNALETIARIVEQALANQP